MNPEQIKKNWESRGYSFGVFKDPPGQVWADFVHRTDELVVLSEGKIEIEIGGNSEQPSIGEEVFIPANALHTVINVGKTNNVWYYGYKNT
jgi:quercetin dioxygenase-like cupin family protein